MTQQVTCRAVLCCAVIHISFMLLDLKCHHVSRECIKLPGNPLCLICLDFRLYLSYNFVITVKKFQTVPTFFPFYNACMHFLIYFRMNTFIHLFIPCLFMCSILIFSLFLVLIGAPWDEVVNALLSNTEERSKTVTLVFERELPDDDEEEEAAPAPATA